MNTEPLCLFIGLFKKTPITKVGSQYCTTRHNLLHKHIVRVFTEYIYFTNRSVLGAKMAVTGATSQVVFFLFFFAASYFRPPYHRKAVEPAGPDLPCSATTCSSQQQRTAPNAEHRAHPGQTFHFSYTAAPIPIVTVQ